MAPRRMSMDRRAYLKTVGASGAVALTGLSGCLGGGGGDGETQSITPGTAPGFPPFEMKEGGELVGFDIDLLEAVVGETDYTLNDWQEFEFKALIPALTNDKIDVIAAAMTITDQRDQTVDFSNPYYSADQAILVREDGSFTPSTLQDLADHKIGAQKGTTGENVVMNQLIKPGLISEQQYNSYGNYVLAIEDLQNGNIDAVVLDTPVANTFASERPVSVAFVYQTGENYGFAVRESSNALVGSLNDGLEAVRASGRYQEITKKWFGQNS
ncbi:MAG: basic amino acid ABC transporter substrate-binding protein [Halanaeroarchaeum sp.]